MKIGILNTGHAPESVAETTGDYPALFRKLLEGRGFEFQTWDVVDMDFPDTVFDAKGWLLTGSKHGVYEDHEFIEPLKAFIRNAYAAGVPQVGICFGHQIIASALGGHVEKFKGGWSVGRQTYDFNGETVALNAWHQDQVVTLPPGATVCGSNDFCQYAGLVYDDRAYTVQPHPEFGADFIEGLATTRGPGVVPVEQLDAAMASLEQPTDNAKFADIIAAFFKRK